MEQNNHPERKEYLVVPSSVDPLQKARAESQTVTESWLKNGEHLTKIQRIGHGMLSLAYIGAGFFLAQVTYEDFKEHSPFGVFFFSLATVFFFFFGFKGMRNVLRFKLARRLTDNE